MLGLNDRIPIREPVVEKKPDAKPGDKDNKKNAKKDSRAKPNEAEAAKPADKPAGDKPADDAESKTADSKPSDSEVAPDDDDPPQVAAPDKARSAGGMYDFREERWVELYAKKIEEMIAVLKSKGVPVQWSVCPPFAAPRPRRTCCSSMRSIATARARPALRMVDVWDGFVDDAGVSRNRARTSKARSAACVRPTVCSSPRPVRASSRIIPNAKSAACSPLTRPAGRAERNLRAGFQYPSG